MKKLIIILFVTTTSVLYATEVVKLTQNKNISCETVCMEGYKFVVCSNLSSGGTMSVVQVFIKPGKDSIVSLPLKCNK